MPFFFMTKSEDLENEKSFQGEKKNFSSILKGVQLPKIVSDLNVCQNVFFTEHLQVPASASS